MISIFNEEEEESEAIDGVDLERFKKIFLVIYFY